MTLFVCLTAVAQSLKIDTIAGQHGTRGNSDGPGTFATFDNPWGVGSDSAGNVYVTMGHCVRKMTPAGVVSTLAGVCSEAGFTDGIGSAARFNRPIGVVVDGLDNVYVADRGNYTIRKIAPEGVVSTMAGVPSSQGVDDGPPGIGRFQGPADLAIDASGNLYVADQYFALLENQSGTSVTIRKVTPDGIVTTIAGRPYTWGYADGPGSQAAFFGIDGLACDAAGNVYISTETTIRRMTPDGFVSTFAGDRTTTGRQDGPLSVATFNDPSGLAFDPDGNLFIVEHNLRTIRRLGTDGQVTTVGGFPEYLGTADGTGTAARLHGPEGLTCTRTGVLYFTEPYDNTIRRGVVTKDGDTNGDGVVSIADLFYLISHLYVDGPPTVGLSDMNRNGFVEAGDVFYFVRYLFAGGPPP